MTVKISGEGTRGTRVSAHVLRPLMDGLLEGAQRAVRLRMEGRSTARGGAPSWLQRASDFDLVAVREGSTQLVLEAPTLASAAPEQFAQVQMFEALNGDLTCLDVLATSLDHAVGKRVDSDYYDDALLGTFEGFKYVFSWGVDLIEIDGEHPVRLEPSTIPELADLKRRIPSPRQVKVSGKLDELRHSDRMFSVVLDDGTNIRGVLDHALGLDDLGPLWGTKVTVSGSMKFRPSGNPLRIEAEAISPATGDASVWSSAPRPLFDELDLKALRQPQGPRSGVSAIYGKWPGDESDDEFEAALAEFR